MSKTSTASSLRHRSQAKLGTSLPLAPPHGRPAVAAALRRLGVRPSKGWGQSFLCDPFVADAEASLTSVVSGEPVVEIGGGLGVLTEALLRRGIQPLTVIERDSRLAHFLRTTFADRVFVMEGDVQTLDFPPARCIVGNLPFSLATPLIVRFWEERVHRFVVLVQREIAERLAAGPGSKTYGRLSILARAFGTVELFQAVPPTAFEPIPEVEGRILRFESWATPPTSEFIDGLRIVLRALFGARRKQLGNLLPRLAEHAGQPDQIARDAAWPADWGRRRPEDLPPDAFFRLTEVLAQRRLRRA